MAVKGTASIFVFIFFIRYVTVMVNADSFDKKTLDGMVLKILWDKVYAGYDIKTKEQSIKNLRKSGDYDKLLNQLVKTKKEKVKKIINLFADIMMEYMY